MTDRRAPDADTVLMMLSALLDGELGPEDEAVVFDAMSQDPALLEAFEALSAARVAPGASLFPGSSAGLSPDEADALAASVLARTAPAEIPANAAGALELTHGYIDDTLDVDGRHHLFTLLDEKPALAAPVAGFVASMAAVQAAARGVSALPAVQAALGHVPDHVDALVAARERSFALCSGALDGALTDAEEAELAAALPALDAGEVFAFAQVRFAGEAVRAASSSPAVLAAAARAGAAALQVLDAEAALAARTSAPAAPAAVDENRPPLWQRLWQALSPARAPLAFGAAAAALFFVVRSPTDGASMTKSDPGNPGNAVGTVASAAATRDALVDALAPAVLAQADGPAAGDLPLLADNSADVEALDATDTTMVFSTEQSKITVIWVEPGT